jgi:hypothetical protein
MLIMFSQLRKRGSRGVSGVRHRFNGTDKVPILSGVESRQSAGAFYTYYPPEKNNKLRFLMVN